MQTEIQQQLNREKNNRKRIERIGRTTKRDGGKYPPHKRNQENLRSKETLHYNDKNQRGDERIHKQKNSSTRQTNQPKYRK